MEIHLINIPLITVEGSLFPIIIAAQYLVAKSTNSQPLTGSNPVEQRVVMHWTVPACHRTYFVVAPLHNVEGEEVVGGLLAQGGLKPGHGEAEGLSLVQGRREVS